MMATVGNVGENILFSECWCMSTGTLWYHIWGYCISRNHLQALFTREIGKELFMFPINSFLVLQMDVCSFCLHHGEKKMKVWDVNPQIYIPLASFRLGQLDGRAQSSALDLCLALPSSAVQPGMTLAELCLHFHVCEKSVCHDPVGFLFLFFKVFWPLLLKRARHSSPWFTQVHGIKAGCLGGTGSLLWRAWCCWRCMTVWSVYILGF